MNKWLITGRLTKAPEVTPTDSGNLIAIIYIASKRNFKNKKTNEYDSDFFRFKAFAKNADFIHSYVKKGDLVEIEASPNNNNYVKDGVTQYRDEYIINGISRLSAKRGDIDG